MEWFSNNLIETMLIIGVILLIVEIVVLGFSTFFLFFAGLATVTTAVLMWLGVLDESFLHGLISIAVFTLLYAGLLWKRLVNLQQDVDKSRASSDLIGHSFVLPSDIVASDPIDKKPEYDYSGITWRVNSEQDLVKGTVVEVMQADVGVFLVKSR